VVRFLNLRYMRMKGAVVPPEFEGSTDEATMRKIQDYERDKTGLGIVSSLFGNIVLVVFIFCGLLNFYNSWITSLHLPFLISGWLFFVLLSWAGEFIAVPFSLYRTFRIENAYGFNTMTLRLWGSDFLKSILLSTVLSSCVVLGGLWLVQWSPNFWWLLVWGFLFLFSIFIMYLSPYVIEPLFNKFTPVEDTALREKIVALTRKAGINASRILRVDASRRSRHTNAYFTGIGRTKRIVLYDTLMEGMTDGEILAVLAHEIGHWKKHHLLKSMIILEVASLAALYTAFRLTGSDVLLSLFRITENTFPAKATLLAFLGGLLSMPLGPLMNALSRNHEREADRIAHELTGDTESMASVFVKLSKENLSNLYPHPLYVVMHYSHPPILERIRHLKEARRTP
jgi:STE24 endopeptidase